jgi:hypothetical protein
MKHRMSADDVEFRRAFEGCEIEPQKFDHAAHVRLAYVYLCEYQVEEAAARMKQSLLEFIAHLGIGEAKYHETITRAWIMAVNHFMAKSAGHASAIEFIAANPELLDSKIMLTHYSAEVLFSPQARQTFVQPDIQSIPEHR